MLKRTPLVGLLLGFLLIGCEPSPEQNSDIRIRQSGTVQSDELDEISGLQASYRHSGVFWVHNDDGPARVFALDKAGNDLGSFDIADGVNVDWEDITMIPGYPNDALVLADFGDNYAARERVWLYLVTEPKPDAQGRFSGEVESLNFISLTYPDGPRDAESISWDPVGERLLILSKRDTPPRLYALSIEKALEHSEATLTFIGEVDTFRPPQLADRREFGERAPWVSQPTGFDIDPVGRRAAVLTYRSLYLYERGENENWLEALNSTPIEILGPPGAHEEAVSFSADGESLLITPEGEGVPLYELSWPAEANGEADKDK